MQFMVEPDMKDLLSYCLPGLELMEFNYTLTSSLLIADTFPVHIVGTRLIC